MRPGKKVEIKLHCPSPYFSTNLCITTLLQQICQAALQHVQAGAPKSCCIISFAGQLGQACVQHADMQLLLIKCSSMAAANATVMADLLYGEEE